MLSKSGPMSFTRFSTLRTGTVAHTRKGTRPGAPWWPRVESEVLKMPRIPAAPTHREKILDSCDKPRGWAGDVESQHGLQASWEYDLRRGPPYAQD